MLRRISIEGFRGLRQAEIIPGPVTLILGQNGAGKTSLCEAIRWALTAGYCRWTRGSGVAQVALLQHGAKAAEVGLEADGWTLKRRMTQSGRTSTEGGAPLAREVLEAVVSAEGFLDLGAREQQALLLGMAGEAITADWLREKLTEEEWGEIKDALDGDLRDLDLVKEAHRAAYALRTAANKERAAAKSKVSAAQEAARKMPKADPAELEAEYDELQAKLGECRRRLGAAEGKSQAGKAVRRAWEQAQEDFEGTLADLDRLGPPLETEPEDPDELLSVAGKRQAQADGKRLEIQKLDGEVHPLERRKAAVEQLSTGVCPFLERPCPTAEEARADLDATSKKIASLRRRIGKLHDQANEAEEEARKARDRAEWARRELDFIEERARLEAELDKRRERLEEAEKACDLPGDVDLAELRQEAERLAQQVAAKRIEVDEAKRAQDARGRLAGLEAELKKREARAAMLDGLVAKLAADGLPAKALAAGIGQVLATINGVLRRFADFALEAEPGAEWELAVIAGGARTPVALLSESERLLVGVAIQMALAHLTDLGFIVTDAVDRLDSDNRQRLLKMLLRSSVQSILTAVPTNGHRPKAKGLVVYEIADGVAFRVGERQAEAAGVGA